MLKKFELRIFSDGNVNKKCHKNYLRFMSRKSITEIKPNEWICIV